MSYYDPPDIFGGPEDPEGHTCDWCNEPMTEQETEDSDYIYVDSSTMWADKVFCSAECRGDWLKQQGEEDD